MSANRSTPLERVLMCLRLAYENSNPNESDTAFKKACEILRRNQIDPRTMRHTDLLMFDSLARSFPHHTHGIPYAQHTWGTEEDKQHSKQQQQAKAGTTRVNQSGLWRNVPDKEWFHRECMLCGLAFSYESYPGNPRRYCSPECKKKATNIDAKWRMRQRRAAAKQQP